MLLERLICVLPRAPDQPWHSMDDAYSACLWDIYPSTQISGIANDDTVIIDGLRAANVRWKSFWPVHVNQIDSWKRFGARWALHTSGYLFLIGCIIAGASSQLPNPTKGSLIGVGIILILWGLTWLSLSPWLIRIIYGGKFWGRQSWLFGFEGYMDIGAIERQIFASQNRLTWSCFGSPLSQFVVDKDGNYEGLDPVKSDPRIAEMVEEAKKAKHGEMRVGLPLHNLSFEMSLTVYF